LIRRQIKLAHLVDIRVTGTAQIGDVDALWLADIPGLREFRRVFIRKVWITPMTTGTDHPAFSVNTGLPIFYEVGAGFLFRQVTGHALIDFAFQRGKNDGRRYWPGGDDEGGELSGSGLLQMALHTIFATDQFVGGERGIIGDRIVAFPA
jgi:hypothetical protein